MDGLEKGPDGSVIAYYEQGQKIMHGLTDTFRHSDAKKAYESATKTYPIEAPKV